MCMYVIKPTMALNVTDQYQRAVVTAEVTSHHNRIPVNIIKHTIEGHDNIH